MNQGPKEILQCFIDGDHYRIGLDKGRTRTQIMKLLGDKNCEEDSYAAFKRRSYMSSRMGSVRKLLDRDGFTLDSMRFPKKPTVYFIVEPGSEERANHHNKLVIRSSNASQRVRVSRLIITQELAKLSPDSKMRKLLVKALAQRT